MSDALTAPLKIKIVEATITAIVGRSMYNVHHNTPNTKAAVLMSTMNPAWALGGVDGYTDTDITIGLYNMFDKEMTGTCRILVFY